MDLSHLRGGLVCLVEGTVCKILQSSTVAPRTRNCQDDKKKIYFNLFVTVTSGLVAFLVGLIEMLGFLAERAHLHGWFFRWIQSANDHSELLGAGVVLIFLVAMAVALCCFRRVFGRSQAPAQSSVYRRERPDSLLS